MTMTIDLDPPEIIFKSVPMGLNAVLSWYFGTEPEGVFVPDDLTGRNAQIVLNPGKDGEVYLPLVVTPLLGRASFILPEDMKSETNYVVVVAETPGGLEVARAYGKIKAGVRVKP